MAAKPQLLKASQVVKLELELELGMVLFQAGGEEQWYGFNFNAIALLSQAGSYYPPLKTAIIAAIFQFNLWCIQIGRASCRERV